MTTVPTAPTLPTVETDVLIVGSGPAGASAALALSTYGVPNVMVTRSSRLADTPRAHITNQRTMEVLRDLGVEEDVIAQATPQHLMGNTVFCTALAGEELGRLRSWGNEPLVQAAHELASPTRMCDMPQHLMEPVLVNAAIARGSQLRFGTEYLSHEQDSDGVTATVRDRLRGDTYTIRAKYLIGADGGRSKVAEDAGLPMGGQMGVAGSINIVFDADLTQYVAHRPATLYWVLAPGATVGGIGAGLVRCVRTWNEWLIVWGYDVDAGPPDLTEEYALSVVRKLIGDDEIPVTIKSSSAWTVNEMYAETYSSGRVFCAGDACHRHPPSNGLGSNTSIQDAYNLAWKLKLVLDGTASPSLLDTYSDERAPVGKQVVTRANQSIGETAPVFDALGGLAPQTPEQLWRNIAARKDATAEAGEQRARLREAIAFKAYEFNAHGVDLNQRYTSAAVVPDGTPDPGFERDPELHFQPSTRPGAKLPHAWLSAGTRNPSTLDLGGNGRFTLITGIGGEPWTEAARILGKEFGLEIATAVIGPGQEYEDPYGDWARLRETGDSGALLVRPDNHVAFRRQDATGDVTAALRDALRQILGRG
ncbi:MULTISPECIES: FAD-dependent oxidoreductase [Streptomyces]|nr:MULTISPECIES: FAD-dependent monooxygenase [Streptomyces]MBP5860673.1 FAD-dependent monooxygenase [Streptomyces sp. LBUM 1484]MBP5870336.1 FAD-dependent monooxygenase [Streptomyces sp. LBUM 1485]KFG09555.1 2,4-dichlorophenol 6-monooxygenase [Streptomyces scabiei]MBP5879064.1 FAD-dependent monooxygenase [Streptomyces sp. LBUM 1477]MBP5886757.1 FAD-dependent monooxygenase [Streptomyces sp. LBUM 1487]